MAHSGRWSYRTAILLVAAKIYEWMAVNQAMDRDALVDLIDRLPDELREEVADYVRYLLERNAIRPRITKRRANLHPGAALMSDDFDAPLDERFEG